jgi:hypothetical protein
MENNQDLGGMRGMGNMALPAEALVIDFAGLTRPVLVPLAARDDAEAEALFDKIKRLQAAAAADNHAVLAPTHVMMKGDRIVGYLSLGGMCTVQAWFDSTHKHAADSIKMIEMGEAIMQDKGIRQYAVAVAEESPFTPHMERMGFCKLGTTVLWLKELSR